jgi:Holliday junction resolvase RusA-like endonuclease
MKNLLFTIYGKLPTLNEYTNSNRTHWGAGSVMKAKATKAAANACMGMVIPTGKTVLLHYNWYVSTKHDLDNIAFGQKFIQDGMVEAGVLPNDSPKYIVGFTHDFHKTEKGSDKVIVSIEVL